MAGQTKSATDRPQLPADISLKQHFPPAGPDEWKAAVKNSSPGLSSLEELSTSTYEGINLKAIYNRNDLDGLAFTNSYPGFPNYVRGCHSTGSTKPLWYICQEAACHSAMDFNKVLKNQLRGGQNAIQITVDQATQIGLDSNRASSGQVSRGGIPISKIEDLETALASIPLKDYPLHLYNGPLPMPLFLLTTAFLRKHYRDSTSIRGSLNCDPLADWLDSGIHNFPLPDTFRQMAQVASWAARYLPAVQTIGIRGIIYHNSGATAAQELAFSLATAVEYIQQLTGLGMDIDTISPRMRISLGIGPVYFMEIAKFRAARILWAEMISHFGGNKRAQQVSIHARTGSYFQTKCEPYLNLLRTTTEAFSAVVGGVDSLHTSPHQELTHQHDEAAERIARNVQTILAEEAGLKRVIDPAGGSYYVERLTHELAAKSWQIFQEIESLGGMMAAIRSGFPQRQIGRIHQKRRGDLAEQKLIMVGCNKYSNADIDSLDSREPDWDILYEKRLEVVSRRKKAGSNTALKHFTDRLNSNDIQAGNGLIDSGIEAVLNGASLGQIHEAVSAGSGYSETVEQLVPERLEEALESESS